MTDKRKSIPTFENFEKLKSLRESRDSVNDYVVPLFKDAYNEAKKAGKSEKECADAGYDAVWEENWDFSEGEIDEMVGYHDGKLNEKLKNTSEANKHGYKTIVMKDYHGKDYTNVDTPKIGDKITVADRTHLMARGGELGSDDYQTCPIINDIKLVAIYTDGPTCYVGKDDSGNFYEVSMPFLEYDGIYICAADKVDTKKKNRFKARYGTGFIDELNKAGIVW